MGTTAYWFGDNSGDLGNYAWFWDNSAISGTRQTHDVGTKKPNAFGLYDMHGNVWECCADWYESDYGISSINSTAIYSDPAGPAAAQTNRVLRGGSWYGRANICRSANRDYITPERRYNNNGFRVVLQF